MCLGIPGQVVEIRDTVHHIGVVSVEGVRREVSLALLSGDGECDVTPGTWVLVHVGFAMARIDEQEAEQTLAALRALGDVYATELSDLSMPAPLRSMSAPSSGAEAPSSGAEASLSGVEAQRW